MWKGQYDAIMGLILIGALALAGRYSYQTGDWMVLLKTFGAWVAFCVMVSILDFLSRAFRGKPLLYDGRIDARRGRDRS